MLVSSATSFLRHVPQARPFLKMHGLRNDFVIVDGRGEPFCPSPTQTALICDRHGGIGGDQLLVMESPRGEDTDAYLRILNVDGPEVGMCGNAVRCVAWLLMEESGRDSVTLQTLTRRVTCRRSGPLSVTVDMGRVLSGWRDIPLREARDTLHLGLESGPLRDPVGRNVGNPHAVCFVPDLDAIDIPAFAPAIQENSLFPESVNVGVAQVLSGELLRLQVWERPGILTEACGSGACAAVSAARARGLLSGDGAEVRMPGGTVRITLTGDDEAAMDGQVAPVFAGWLPA